MHKIYYTSFPDLQAHLKTLGIRIEGWVSRGDGCISPAFSFEEASFLDLSPFTHPYSKLRVTKLSEDKEGAEWDVDLDRVVAFLQTAYTKGREFQHQKMLAF